MRPNLQQISKTGKVIISQLATDMNSNQVSLQNQGTNVTPNLLHDHTNPLEYIVPTGNGAAVTIGKFVNWEEASLHYVVLDNSKNLGTTISKVFTFHPDYIFLDDPTNVTNSYAVDPGKKQIWWGSIWQGKLYLRVSIDSTN